MNPMVLVGPGPRSCTSCSVGSMYRRCGSAASSEVVVRQSGLLARATASGGGSGVLTPDARQEGICAPVNEGARARRDLYTVVHPDLPFTAPRCSHSPGL